MELNSQNCLPMPTDLSKIDCVVVNPAMLVVNERVSKTDSNSDSWIELKPEN